MLKEQMNFFDFEFLNGNPHHITRHWNVSTQYLAKNFRSPKGFYSYDMSSCFLLNNETLIEGFTMENIMFLILSFLVLMYLTVKGKT